MVPKDAKPVQSLVLGGGITETRWNRTTESTTESTSVTQTRPAVDLTKSNNHTVDRTKSVPSVPTPPPTHRSALVPRITIPGLKYPIEVVALLAGPSSPGAFQTAQSMTAIGMSTCSPLALQALADDHQWSLSPLFALTGGKSSYFSEPLSVTPILANIFLGIGVFAMHKALSWKFGATTAMFPALSLKLADLLLQGTTFYAVRHLGGPMAGTGWDAVALFIVVALPGGIISYAVYFHMHFQEPRSSFALYKASVVDSTRFQKMFLPRGYYLSVNDVSMYSPLFDAYIPGSRTLILVRYIHLILLGIMTAIPATGNGCDAVIPLIAIIQFLTSFYHAFAGIRTRARIFSVTYGLGLFVNGVIALVGRYTTSDEALSVLANVILAVMLVEAAATAGNLWWECFRAEGAKELALVDLEMPLVGRLSDPVPSAATVSSVLTPSPGKEAVRKPSAPSQPKVKAPVVDFELTAATVSPVPGTDSGKGKEAVRKPSAPSQPKVKAPVVIDFEL